MLLGGKFQIEVMNPSSDPVHSYDHRGGQDHGSVILSSVVPRSPFCYLLIRARSLGWDQKGDDKVGVGVRVASSNVWVLKC